MAEQVALRLSNRNPDVLTCIANLSNDEVFTPPEVADRMLDLVAASWADAHAGANIWADPSVRFLDPFTKSGVFLRQITSRLTEGLKQGIPNLEERVDHILTKQVFGIGITHLTSLLARRSVYCSKWANGKHSIATSFENGAGNIWFESMEHTWSGATEFIETADADGKPVRRGTNGRCSYCGASQLTLDRASGLESHAYAFIHTDDIKARIAELFGDDMQFDVIVGNPPYQLQAGGGTRDMPIYQHFVEQAKRLAPRYLVMVIPSRWMASGLGLGEFRRTMLADTRIRELVDYPNAADVFPSVGINGGVCYFLWDSSHEGDCNVTMVRGGEVVGPMARSLGEFDVLVRDGRALTILRKVLERGEASVNTILARDKEFGWTSNFDGFREVEGLGDVPLYYIRSMKRGHGFIDRDAVTKSAQLVDTWKLLVPKVGSGREREKSGVDLVLGPPLIAPSPSVCTQSFLFFYLDSREEAQSLRTYYATKFFRFLVSLRKITQDATHSTYSWVPMQEWDRSWTDGELFTKYGLTDEEIAFIESMIRPMELAEDASG
ncbi:MAG: Eco57I restriction-modification methylase domain-containing protein [Propionicimonas sp.]